MRTCSQAAYRLKTTVMRRNSNNPYSFAWANNGLALFSGDILVLEEACYQLCYFWWC